MKSNTMIWLGINHVGDSTHHGSVEQLCAADAIRKIARFIGHHSLATRMEFVIARTQQEVADRLNERRNVGVGSRSINADASIHAELESMLAEMGVEEA